MVQFLSSCNPKVLPVHWSELKLMKRNKCDVLLWKQRIRSRALPIWSEFRRLHIREFKPKQDKIDHNSLVNPQQILGHECLFSTIVNLASKGNCCSDLFPDVLSCVSDRVFPARENMHRFSRWAEVMGAHPPALVLQLCSALNWACDDCARELSLFKEDCAWVPHSPTVQASWVICFWENWSQHPYSARKDSPWENHSLDHELSHSCFHSVTLRRWTIFLVAQACRHCSPTQSSYRRNLPLPSENSCLRRPRGTSGMHPRGRNVTSHFTGCAAGLPGAFLGQSTRERGLFCHAVLWDKLAKRHMLFYL